MFTDPSFWVGLAFLLVVALVFKPAAKAISGTLDGRASKIREQIEEARKLREDAQALLAGYQSKQGDATAEAESIISQAKAEAARMKTEAEANLARTLERREQQALERISQSEAQALAQVRSTAVDVALSAAEALIRENLDDGKKKSLTDQAIGELQRRFN
jgi:F-type H+-transporting ATPase subunit b